MMWKHPRAPRPAMALTLTLLALPAAARADDSTAPTVPGTRREMLQALEDSKRAQPRLPLPPLTEEEKAQAGPVDLRQGRWGIVNNGRMRKHYLPPEVAGGGFVREPDPVMTLGYPFQTMLFWIVSRANNCTYCMGHQESKLAASGLDDDRIGALDGDWSEFTPAERAAFALARDLTYEPHRITDETFAEVRRHYNDTQILEMVLVIGNFNAMNRWTGALRIPQEEHHDYSLPANSRHKNQISRVAPLDPSRPAGALACARPAARPALESRAEVEEALSACRQRTPRLPLATEPAARAALTPGTPDGPVPAWARLLAVFPKAGVARISMHQAAERPDIGTLDPKLRAEIAWVAARHDRAWYALAAARARLKALGFSDDQIFALDAPADGRPESEQAVLNFARKLTVDPALITDADIEGLRKHFSDRQVAEIVHQVTEAAFFNRLTEAAALPCEG